jgi:hypothetical protein
VTGHKQFGHRLAGGRASSATSCSAFVFRSCTVAGPSPVSGPKSRLASPPAHSPRQTQRRPGPTIHHAMQALPTRRDARSPRGASALRILFSSRA